MKVARGAAPIAQGDVPRHLYRSNAIIILVATFTLAILAVYSVVSVPDFLSRWPLSGAGIAIAMLWLALAFPSFWLARNRPGIPVAIVLAVGVISSRVAIGIVFSGHILGGDALFYPIMARALLRGDGLRIYEPFIGSILRGLYPPAYPFLLSGWSVLAGFSTASLVVLNTIIDGLTAVLLLRLGARMGHPAAGRGAAWLYMIWPSVLLSAPVAQKEGLCALLVVGLALVWLESVDDRRGRIAVAIGVLTGLLALTQPALALLPVIMGALLLRRVGVGVFYRTAFPAAVTAALVMLPWWIRNWLVFGTFVPLTTSGPISFWIGNNAQATGNWVPTPIELRGLPELQYARAAGELAWIWIREHPLDFLRLTATKFVRAIALSGAELARFAQSRPAPIATQTNALLPMCLIAHIGLLGLSGWAIGLRHSRMPAPLLAIMLACAIQLVGVNVWFEFGERHREFVTPFLLLACLCASTLTVCVDDPGEMSARKRSEG